MTVSLGLSSLFFTNKYRPQIFPNDVGRLCCVDTLPKSLGLVIISNWSCLSVECLKTSLQRFNIVIWTLDQRFACNVIDTFFFWRAERRVEQVFLEKRFNDLPKFLVVCATTRCMDETSSDTRYKELVVNEKLYNWVELFTAVLKHAVQFLCLRHGTRETVKNKTGMARVSSQFYACFRRKWVRIGPNMRHRFIMTSGSLLTRSYKTYCFPIALWSCQPWCRLKQDLQHPWSPSPSYLKLSSSGLALEAYHLSPSGRHKTYPEC